MYPEKGRVSSMDDESAEVGSMTREVKLGVVVDDDDDDNVFSSSSSQGKTTTNTYYTFSFSVLWPIFLHPGPFL